VKINSIIKSYKSWLQEESVLEAKSFLLEINRTC